MKTKQQYVSEIEKECIEAGINFSDILKNQFEGEWFEYIINKIKDGEKISQEIFGSLDELQKYYLNKHFIIQGINIIEDETVKEIKIEVVKYKKGMYLETVKGKEVKIESMIFGIYENNEDTYEKQDKWFIIDLKSGISIAHGSTEEEALNDAKLNMIMFKEKQLEDSYKEMIETFESLKAS